MISVEKKAGSVDQAIEECLKALQLSKDEVDIEILSSGGILSKALVRATKKETIEDKAITFINGLMNKMSLDCVSSINKGEDGNSFINISGNDNGIAIGYRGEVLDAIQYITMLAVNRDRNESQEFTKISINAESYREKRTSTLTDLAGKLASKVARTGYSVELEPMNPFERRIVHTALQDNDSVITESYGVEPNRYVVIKPKHNTRASGNGGTKNNNTGYKNNNNSVNKNNFNKTGPGKTRSFGGGSRKPF